MKMRPFYCMVGKKCKKIMSPSYRGAKARMLAKGFKIAKVSRTKLM